MGNIIFITNRSNSCNSEKIHKKEIKKRFYNTVQPFYFICLLFFVRSFLNSKKKYRISHFYLEKYTTKLYIYYKLLILPSLHRSEVKTPLETFFYIM